MKMDHIVRLDKRVGYSLIIVLIMITSCRSKLVKETVNNSPPITIRENSIVKNCFLKNDRPRIIAFLEKLESGCINNEYNFLFSDEFVSKSRPFSCELFNNALKNVSTPDFEIQEGGMECNIVAVYYNYFVKITDVDESYSSESTFIIYLIKTVEDKILLDNFAAAG